MRHPMLPLLLVALAFTACGKDDPNPNGGYSGPVQADPDYWEEEDFSSFAKCELDVIDRFRDVREACDFEYGRGRRSDDCRTYGDGFLAAYPAMSCRAEGVNPKRPRPYGISARHVKWMMRKYYKRWDRHDGPNGGWTDNDGLPRPRPNDVGQIPPIPQQPPYPRRPNHPQQPNYPQGPSFPRQPNYPQPQFPQPQYPGYFQPQPGYAPQPGFYGQGQPNFTNPLVR
jgi:hypothetical protein